MFIKNQFNFKTALKYFSLPFTLFGPCGAVIIINSKMNLRKKSLKEYFKTISHCFRVYPLSGFISTASSSLLSLKFRSPFFRCYIFRGKDFQPLVQSGIGLQPAVFFFFFFFFASEILCDSPGDSPGYSKQRMHFTSGKFYRLGL